MIDPKDPEKNKHIPSLEEVTDAYSDILDHNRRFAGIDVAYDSSINELITDAILLDEEELEKKRAEEKRFLPPVTQGNEDTEFQEVVHGDSFYRIGIKLLPLGEASYYSMSGAGAAAPKLVPTIINSTLYVDFLRQQTKETVNREETDIRLMTDVVRTLRMVVEDTYKGEPGSTLAIENGEDALRAFTAIDEIYQKLGLDMPEIYKEYMAAPQSGHLDEAWRKMNMAREYESAYHELQNYVHYWGENVLPEYLIIGSPAELSQPKPWVGYGQMEILDHQVQYLVGLVGPERTTKFGLEATEGMIQGIEATLKSMNGGAYNWMNQTEGVKSGLERNLSRLRALLKR